MESLIRDLRHGVRTMARNKGVTLAAVFALALGIGANSAMFSAAYALLLRPLPVRDSGRLATIVAVNPRFDIRGIEPGFSVYASWKEQARSYESMGAAAAGTATVSLPRGESEQVRYWRVSASFLPTLGVAPAIGRNFLTEEDQPGAAPVALLSDELWRRRFAADPRVAGAEVVIEGKPHAIVGVLPKGFHVNGKPAEVYAPIAMSPNAKEWLAVSVYARLKPGVTMEQARAEMEVLSGRAPNRAMGWSARVWGLREWQVRDVRLSVLVLLGAVGLVLLIACANVASLLLARANARRKEIAIRAALGAGRARLIRQMLAESTTLALAGGAAGLGIAALCARLAPQLETTRIPPLIAQTRTDLAVLGFTIALSLVTGLVFGALPAFSSSRANAQEALKEGGRAGESRRSKRAWSFLVVTETALALLLTIGATLLIRSFFWLRDVAPGFRVDRLLTARLTPRAKFTSPEQAVDFYNRVIEQVRAVPGVQSATFASALPLDGNFMAMSMPIEGHQFAKPQDYPILWWRNVEKDYFRTMEIPLRRGRVFEERDRLGAPRVAMINETMARRFWPGQDPIGKRLGSEKAPIEVVGLVADVRHQDSTREAPVEVYFPALQAPPRSISLAVRASGDPMRLAPAIAAAVARVDREQKLTQLAEIEDVISDRIAPKRVSAALIAVFAGLALTLAAVGIYGVLSFSVAQRTHEIGVRIALGAERGAVLRMVVSKAVLLALAGVAIGLAAAFGLTRVMKTLLFGVSATDPLAYGGAAAALVAMAALAAYIPARRAALIDPLRALRHE